MLMRWSFGSVAALMLAAGCGSEKASDPCIAGAELAKRADYSAALQEWRSAAYDESHKEWWRATKTCMASSGLATDDAAVADWLKNATSAGSSDAAIMLALAHVSGAGVSKDADEAKRLLALAAQQGNESGQKLLDALNQSEPAPKQAP